jgi:hypothetical protein
MRERAIKNASALEAREFVEGQKLEVVSGAGVRGLSPEAEGPRLQTGYPA